MNQADEPIRPDDPLGRLLAQDAVPSLASNFADRVVAQTEGRVAPLPRQRRLFAPARHWSTARRVTVGVLAAGALATTAAATGVLDQLPIALPTPQDVWASIAGGDQNVREQRNVVRQPVEQVTEVQRVEIVGPIDTSEELEEAFTRIDRVRETRIERRRTNVDKRIDTVIERRREMGLPVPDESQEAQLREVMGEIQNRREERLTGRIEDQRAGLRERIENGEELTRDDILPNRGNRGGDGQFMRDRMERLRQLPPAQRRAVVRRFLQRQEQRSAMQAETADEPSADPVAAEPDVETDQADPPQ